ncbi:cell division protein DivIB [Streptococcus parasuis]|nr:cell division protein DivIB [Streptococcus parasuis]
MDEKDPKELVENKNSEPSLDLESSVPTMDASDDEKSAFFDQWKARHQAYLEEHKIEEESPIIEQENDKTSFLKKGRKARKLEDKAEGIVDSSRKRIEKKKAPLPKGTLLRAVPVLLVSCVLFFLSIYFMTPYSKTKLITVEGNERLTAQQVEELSLISPKDYAVTIALNAANYASNIKKSNPEVSDAAISFYFPNKFTIRIKEYAVVGYMETGSQYYRILANGEAASEGLSADQLPETYLLFKLTDQASIKLLAKQLAKVDTQITSKILEIRLTPTKATSDLLTLKMSDGNTILVPLSEIETKLPYYSKISLEIVEPSIVDMEVGIFRYVSSSQ